MNENTAMTIMFVIRIVVPFVILMSIGEIARLHDKSRFQAQH